MTARLLLPLLALAAGSGCTVLLPVGAASSDRASARDRRPPEAWRGELRRGERIEVGRTDGTATPARWLGAPVRDTLWAEVGYVRTAIPTADVAWVRRPRRSHVRPALVLGLLADGSVAAFLVLGAIMASVGGR